MTRHNASHIKPVPTEIESTSVGVVGLFLPFLLVIGAAIVLGGLHPPQLALSALLIVFPVAILLVRRNARDAQR